MSKSMKVLVLAGILSIAAASAVQAGGHGTSGDFHANAAPAGGTARSGQIPTLWRRVMAGGHATGGDFHASTAPACGYECPVLAGDGGPGNPTDGTGRSAEVTIWHPMLAGGGVRTGDISF